ncbi:hypothetical protein IY145_17285 [Methylosinus sp. H3A]|uniref:trypco2 family protein n=1 Tax=Methylosinus sp. H3A TaxID=2785786 RepID=UPI0018C30D8A|nr:trypco2 family protein [Methylosinus sp. H3A]MBG0811127.1 hypothetical protein [Methylosinus sp. H3A]
MADTIPLKEALQSLRAEIISAAEDASGEEIRFELGPIEMEFQVVAQRSAGGDGKIGFHIFGAEASVGASGKIESSRTQKIKLTLKPERVVSPGLYEKVEVLRDD